MWIVASVRSGPSLILCRGGLYMPVDLSGPLDWKAASGDELEMLEALQPNIVKAHVRDHLFIELVHFDDADDMRTFLRAVAVEMKSAVKERDSFFRMILLGKYA